MSFIQIIECHTSHFDEIQALDREWEKATEGRRTLQRSIVARDRNDPTRHLIFAFFDSAEAAKKNSDLPETTQFAEKMAKLTDGPMQFSDLDIVDERP